MSRLRQARDTKVGMTVSDEMLLNEAKYQGYSFYRFIDKGEPTGAGGDLPPTPYPHFPPTQTRLGLKA